MLIESKIDWKEEFTRQREHSIALESARADLMGLNEELRLKIAALERGQCDLLSAFKALYEFAKAIDHQAMLGILEPFR